MTMTTWIPKVGDKLKMIAHPSHSNTWRHGNIGTIFEVESVSSLDNGAGTTIIFTDCTCPPDDEHRKAGSRGWTWASYWQLFEPYIELTPEEMAKAKSLPDVCDVARFFGLQS